MDVVITGDPFDGMLVYGPFHDLEDANEYADIHVSGTWWVMELQKPSRKFWGLSPSLEGELFVVTTGNIFEGIVLHGPFKSRALAEEWAVANEGVGIDLIVEPDVG